MPLRAGLHRDDIGAGARLGHGERADMLAGDELSEIAALLLVRAVAADLIDAEGRVRAIGEPDRGGRAGEFLPRDAGRRRAGPRPTPLLPARDAVQAELAQLGPEVARKNVAAVDLLGARRNARSGKAAHALAQHVGRLAEAEIKSANVVHAHGRHLACRQAADRPPSSFRTRLMHVLDRTSNIARAATIVRPATAAAPPPPPCARRGAREE